MDRALFDKSLLSSSMVSERKQVRKRKHGVNREKEDKGARREDGKLVERGILECGVKNLGDWERIA